MIERDLRPSLEASLGRFPAVGLVGARQSGKTTLAKALAQGWPRPSVYLDLERPSDLSKLADPELFLVAHASDLVILDEVQRAPEIFAPIRSLVDEDRRPGRFLLLGSASPELLRQSSETLAGRIVYHELGPLRLAELGPGTGAETLNRLWLRGGFPPSYLAGSDEDSAEWRMAFLQTFLERDLPGLGFRTPAPAQRRFVQMLAHWHGQLWNASRVAASLGVSAPTARRHLDALEAAFLVRGLQPFHPNVRKRLVKAPRYYLRDSGLLHALLGAATRDDLLGHPMAGASWEGWVIEQALGASPPAWRPWFYRTAAGAEADLVLERPGSEPPLAIEAKLSAAPSASKGFRSALADLGGAQGLIVYPGAERYPLGESITALPAREIGSFLRGM